MAQLLGYLGSTAYWLHADGLVRSDAEFDGVDVTAFADAVGDELTSEPNAVTASARSRLNPSLYLALKNLWNDPGSGRFIKKGRSTEKARSIQMSMLMRPGAAAVRDAAEATGTVRAVAADNRMSRGGISAGEVVEVAYKNATHGRVSIRSASGKLRTYDVQWERFSGLEPERPSISLSLADYTPLPDLPDAVEVIDIPDGALPPLARDPWVQKAPKLPSRVFDYLSDPSRVPVSFLPDADSRADAFNATRERWRQQLSLLAIEARDARSDEATAKLWLHLIGYPDKASSRTWLSAVAKSDDLKPEEQWLLRAIHETFKAADEERFGATEVGVRRYQRDGEGVVPSPTFGAEGSSGLTSWYGRPEWNGYDEPVTPGPLRNGMGSIEGTVPRSQVLGRFGDIKGELIVADSVERLDQLLGRRPTTEPSAWDEVPVDLQNAIMGQFRVEVPSDQRWSLHPSATGGNVTLVPSTADALDAQLEVRRDGPLVMLENTPSMHRSSGAVDQLWSDPTPEENNPWAHLVAHFGGDRDKAVEALQAAGFDGIVTLDRRPGLGAAVVWNSDKLENRLLDIDAPTPESRRITEGGSRPDGLLGREEPVVARLAMVLTDNLRTKVRMMTRTDFSVALAGDPDAPLDSHDQRTLDTMAEIASRTLDAFRAEGITHVRMRRGTVDRNDPFRSYAEGSSGLTSWTLVDGLADSYTASSQQTELQQALDPGVVEIDVPVEQIIAWDPPNVARSDGSFGGGEVLVAADAEMAAKVRAGERPGPRSRPPVMERVKEMLAGLGEDPFVDPGPDERYVEAVRPVVEEFVTSRLRGVEHKYPLMAFALYPDITFSSLTPFQRERVQEMTVDQITEALIEAVAARNEGDSMDVLRALFSARLRVRRGAPSVRATPDFVLGSEGDPVITEVRDVFNAVIEAMDAVPGESLNRDIQLTRRDKERLAAVIEAGKLVRADMEHSIRKDVSEFIVGRLDKLRRQQGETERDNLQALAEDTAVERVWYDQRDRAVAALLEKAGWSGRSVEWVGRATADNTFILDGNPEKLYRIDSDSGYSAKLYLSERKNGYWDVVWAGQSPNKRSVTLSLSEDEEAVKAMREVRKRDRDRQRREVKEQQVEQMLWTGMDLAEGRTIPHERHDKDIAKAIAAARYEVVRVGQPGEQGTPAENKKLWDLFVEAAENGEVKWAPMASTPTDKWAPTWSLVLPASGKRINRKKVGDITISLQPNGEVHLSTRVGARGGTRTLVVPRRNQRTPWEDGKLDGWDHSWRGMWEHAAQRQIGIQRWDDEIGPTRSQAALKWAEEAFGSADDLPVGADDPELRDLVRRVAVAIPKPMRESAGSVDVQRGTRSRGFYQSGIKRITVRTNSESTMLHEYGHHVEKDPAVLRALWAFYVHRTGGDATKVKKLRTMFPGNRYGRDEEARADEFYSGYAGKRYWGSDSRTGARSYEVFTMGLEGVFFGRTGYRTTGDPRRGIDDEHASFILGLLGWAQTIMRHSDPTDGAVVIEGGADSGIPTEGATMVAPGGVVA
ncbi:MAG: hypothetical protein ACOYOQ_00210 [Microthrixaceae bacterium]